MPKATVAALIFKIINNELNILLTKRNIEPFKNCWCLPGGHIDKYESAKDAIIREVKEETGIDFDGNFYKYFDEIIPQENIHAVVLVYLGTSQSKAIIDNKEVSEVDWFSETKLKDLKLAFKHNEILFDYFSLQND